ncbi:MAG: hypothetical protein ACPL3C_01380 [Pyrobaculum sp.]|uniref:hypothetical protein n=1 Tax=Pyrobaculum sp. TaxID=2004705 RepID=UPI003CBEFCEC
MSLATVQPGPIALPDLSVLVSVLISFAVMLGFFISLVAMMATALKAAWSMVQLKEL